MSTIWIAPLDQDPPRRPWWRRLIDRLRGEPDPWKGWQDIGYLSEDQAEIHIDGLATGVSHVLVQPPTLDSGPWWVKPAEGGIDMHGWGRQRPAIDPDRW